MNPYLPMSIYEIEKQLDINVFIDELISTVSNLDIYKEKLKSSKINPLLYLPTLQNKEAIASNKIEGTQSTLNDILFNKVTQNEKDKNINEVINYYNVVMTGYDELKTEKIDSNYIKKIHKVMMSGNTRGKKGTLGEYRKIQNYIGTENATITTASFVPPTHDKIEQYIEELVDYINNPIQNKKDSLIRAAIIHAQFETIHPFIDGNGRIGRILIPLYLYSHKVITLPCFFISESIEKDKYIYYSLLNETRFKNNWNDWMKFFLKAVSKQCEKYIQMVGNINELYERNIEICKDLFKNINILDFINLLFKYPIINVNLVVENSNIPYSTALRYLKILTENKILYPNEKIRNTTYFYYDLLNLINE